MYKYMVFKCYMPVCWSIIYWSNLDPWGMMMMTPHMLSTKNMCWCNLIEDTEVNTMDINTFVPLSFKLYSMITRWTLPRDMERNRVYVILSFVFVSVWTLCRPIQLLANCLRHFSQGREIKLNVNLELDLSLNKIGIQLHIKVNILFCMYCLKWISNNNDVFCFCWLSPFEQE